MQDFNLRLLQAQWTSLSNFGTAVKYPSQTISIIGWEDMKCLQTKLIVLFFFPCDMAHQVQIINEMLLLLPFNCSSILIPEGNSICGYMEIYCGLVLCLLS